MRKENEGKRNSGLYPLNEIFKAWKKSKIILLIKKECVVLHIYNIELHQLQTKICKKG